MRLPYPRVERGFSGAGMRTREHKTNGRRAVSGPLRIARASAGLALIATSVSLLILAAAPPSGAEARGLVTGFFAREYLTTDDQLRNTWFDATVESKAGIVRIAARWRSIAEQQPANPTDPADPAYDFSLLDPAVRAAQQRGLDVMFTVVSAPDWAEGPNRPSEAQAPAGTWDPNPQAYGAFAQALATRYSGSYPDPSNPAAALPRVRNYEGWNEPNLTSFLGPQWNGGKPNSPGLYLSLLNSLAAGVKAVHPDNRAIGPALAPFGDPPGGARVRPLKFLREMFCLKGKKKPTSKKGCSKAARPSLDVLSYHLINITGPPPTHAANPDDATSGDLGRVTRVLRAAEKAGNVTPRGRHPLWVTEFAWYSNPPTEASFAYPPPVQAQYIEQSLYMWWSEGAEVAMNFQIRDVPAGFDSFTFGTGVFFQDGAPKPAFDAFRFPFVADRQRKKKKVLLWGKAPATGQLEIQRQAGGGWDPLKQLNVSDGAVFTTRLKIGGAATLRAIVGEDVSLPWRLGR